MKPQTKSKQALKRLLRYVPTLNWTRRYPDLNRLEDAKLSVLCQILLKETGHMVYGGPFSTMKLAEDLELAWDPRIITGSYEEEVHAVINDVICAAPSNIIDIGSSFGYYAVGLALKVETTTVHAFEAVPEPHWQQLERLAAINGVASKLVQYGTCAIPELAKVCRPQSFILCDCEGAEEDLLQPSQIPTLRTCKILVELHEFNRPGLLGKLIPRFRETHNIRLIEGGERNHARYGILKRLPPAWRPIAIEETKWISDQSAKRISTWLRFMLLDPK